MKKKINYIIENKIITNIKKEENIKKLFSQKIAIIILNEDNNLPQTI